MSHNKNFLLNSPWAERLFHEVAKELPIVDYHCHIDPQQLFPDARFDNISSLWVKNDPYKHRAMRICGVPEVEITGAASDEIKFKRWCETVPKTLGNPLYAWSHMELQTFFGVEGPIDAAQSSQLWQHLNAQCAQSSMTTGHLFERVKLEHIVTSDRLLDNLTTHQDLSRQQRSITSAPSLRGEEILTCGGLDSAAWLSELSRLTEVQILDLESLEQALEHRLNAFHQLGCRFADMGLDVMSYGAVSRQEAESALKTCLSGGWTACSSQEKLQLHSWLLLFLGRFYAAKNWVMMLHIGAFRFTSTRLRKLAGPAGGYATLGNTTDIPTLCAFLDALDAKDQLPRTILFTLNPADHDAFATLTGSYSQDGVAGKVQFGPAWWYNDHFRGIDDHLDALCHYGLLWNFIGMTTDSRSILSMVRHEYFRRVVCDHIGRKIQNGQLPSDFAACSALIQRICYQNAHHWTHS